jgi:hypothetical protein
MNEADRDRDLSGTRAQPGKDTGSRPLEVVAADGQPVASPAARSIDIQAYIGQQLRAVYEDVAKQPVPDRFLELMRQLDTK